MATLKSRLKALIDARKHIVLVGSKGCGKTLVARKIVEFLPEPTPVQSVEIYATGKAAGLSRLSGLRPFRAPHHTVSQNGMFGFMAEYKDGTSRVVYGECMLAHYGVLFMDEIEEFASSVLNRLIEPLTSGSIQLYDRAARAHLNIPANFLLVASCNDWGLFSRRVPESIRRMLCVLEVNEQEAREFLGE